MVREINVKRHIAVLIIVSLVFILGMLIGMRQGMDAVSTLTSDYDSLSMDSAMMDTIFLMQNSEMDSSESCRSYTYLFDRYNSDLANFNNRMWEMEQSLGKKDPALMALKDKFSTLEVRNYFLLRKVDETCGANHTAILYFYTNKNYDPERDQGAVIQQAIASTKNRTMVYHFDIDVKNPAVDMLVRHYKIDVAPAVVVDGKAYQGYHDLGEMRSILSG